MVATKNDVLATSSTDVIEPGEEMVEAGNGLGSSSLTKFSGIAQGLPIVIDNVLIPISSILRP